MSPGIIIPVAIVVVVVPMAIMIAHRRFKNASSSGDFDDSVLVSSALRLTSGALRPLPSPPWRAVYEIGTDKIGGTDHVLIGPPGIFAVRTSLDPMPSEPETEASPQRIAGAAVARGELDDILRRCALSSRTLISVHWGVSESNEVEVDLMPGVTAINGRSLADWAEHLQPLADAPALSPAQVDLAWQTVTTAIGRPDPLA